MDSAQITSIVRHLLTMAGTLAAGTAFSGWFDSTTIDAVVGAVGSCVLLVSVVWAHRSNAPQALARKLVDNPQISNAAAGKAIAAGEPEKVQVKP